jgi:hypothetical protein
MVNQVPPNVMVGEWVHNSGCTPGLWLVAIVLGCTLWLPASAFADTKPSTASVAPNAKLETILGKLASTTSSDRYRQIDAAVRSSPHLIDQLNGLAASGGLTEILVLTPAMASNAPKPGPFSAWTAGTSMVFTESLLSQLTKNREYDIVYPDDVLPNNTTFVLGHLAFHLQAGKVAAKPDGALNVNDFVAAMLDQEARAYIQSWNDVLDAAVQQNNDEPLRPRQIANLMLNLRYRFAFLAALRQPTDKIRLEQNGVIEESEANAKGIATALKSSSVADIQ